MKTATVTTEPEGQIVHLPAEIRLESGEVFVRQVGRSVVLVPKGAGPWRSLIDSLDQFSDDYMEDRARPAPQQSGMIDLSKSIRGGTTPLGTSAGIEHVLHSNTASRWPRAR
jgi:antitoxin VapB